MAIRSILLQLRYILRPFSVFYGHLVYFFSFGMLYQEKSGNPAEGDFFKTLIEVRGCIFPEWGEGETLMDLFGTCASPGANTAIVS
jgi:hypothetical protein